MKHPNDSTNLQTELPEGSRLHKSNVHSFKQHKKSALPKPKHVKSSIAHGSLHDAAKKAEKKLRNEWMLGALAEGVRRIAMLEDAFRTAQAEKAAAARLEEDAG